MSQNKQQLVEAQSENEQSGVEEPDVRCGVEITNDIKQGRGIKPSIQRLIPVPEQTLLMGSADDETPVMLFIEDAWPASSWQNRTATQTAVELNDVTDILVTVHIRPLSGGALPMMSDGYDIQDDDDAVRIKCINAGCLFGADGANQHPDVPSDATWRVEE
ncbi:hypothetical protein [Salinibaculum rarum]|uniref:hypothetical protein n=1 Tax=Salinibaculum rarum TaxID=3058903 RepID=UPI00265E16C4|nr:hypothetical protein [Salinibaculum sp. KK48]